MNPAFDEVLAAGSDVVLSAFDTTALRLGTASQNIEKDFWVCWTLDALFNGLKEGGPRLPLQGRNLLVQRFRSDQPLLRRHRCHGVSGRHGLRRWFDKRESRDGCCGDKSETAQSDGGLRSDMPNRARCGPNENGHGTRRRTAPAHVEVTLRSGYARRTDRVQGLRQRLCVPKTSSELMP